MGSRPPGGEAAGPIYGAPGEDAGCGFDIEVVLEDPAWRSAVPRVQEVARRAAAAAFAEGGPDEDGIAAVTVLLTGDHQVKRLNGDHRGKVKPTNVLSFPPLHPGLPGDVALALGVVRREARVAGRSVMAHLSHLVAHGVLHLLGHDHLHAGEARRMERAEARIMRRLALPNPWRGVA
ncbi:rRNA maturation RNase YbeY [Muricoccus pecuniae]|uniref:Endoribonuclease YbeY n=1 Tax=Muricoccus pecuniae TaxID=693023 RepID=A0A840YF04_9PROT|nr:rRNA maturation RNase YbeY [Roseomonas pecuniae]MBB5692463.1 putative rRNA maturation factor [Roseomonas pecuniae]